MDRATRAFLRGVNDAINLWRQQRKDDDEPVGEDDRCSQCGMPWGLHPKTKDGTALCHAFPLILTLNGRRRSL